ncbi:MAG: YihY/virulence factor BrkB family protein [Xanthobacteraceae bacterium]
MLFGRRSRKRSEKPSLLLSLLVLLGATAVVTQLDRAREGATGVFGTTRSTDEPSEWQHARAREPGRGRDATAPWQIPWAGWKDVFWRSYEQIGEDRLLAVAAGVVFYGLLALFPAITAFVSFYGLFAKGATINQHLSLIAGVAPEGAFGIVEEQINRIVSKGDVKLSFGFVFGLGLAVWSANAGMKAVIDALNVVYDEKEKRSFIKLNLLSLGLTVAAIAALLMAIGAVVVFPLVLAHFGFGDMSETLIGILRWPALLVLVLLGLAILYRFGPSRREPRWQWVSVGSLFAAIVWLAGSALFSWYLGKFAHYDETYGSLGAAIGLMMWMWLSVIVILVGAELNSEVEHQTARDSTVGGEKPLGTRGAAMADTVGAAQTP